jgi:tungstate transport system substrate-binding protein
MTQRTIETFASRGGPRLRRRDLGLVVAGAAAATLPASLAGTPAAAAGDRRTVRLASIPAVQTGGLLNQLLARFQADSPYQVVTTIGETGELYQLARDGEVDLVLSHLGVTELPEFVTDGPGRWPQLVLATVFAFLAPPADPAGVRQAGDAVDAFGRIAQTGSPFVVNNLGNIRFVTDILWHAAGQPDQLGWYLDTGLSGPAAAQAAAQLGGYTIWGLHPFLALQQQQPVDLRAVTFDDSLLQRGVASVVVTPGSTRQVNLAGALALERFLLAASTQGVIRAFRHPQFPRPIFWPAAHHNAHE